MLMYFFSISSYSNAGTMVLDQGKVGMAGGFISRIQKRGGGTALDGGRRREGEGEREREGREEEGRRESFTDEARRPHVCSYMSIGDNV